MKAYKLTDSNGYTRKATYWGEGVSHTVMGTETKLCSNGWIHFYTDPLLAVLMNPAHANFKLPIMWECETDGKHLHETLKSGCETLTTIKQIPIPEVTMTQRIAFGILCAKEVYKDAKWNKWADDWLNGTDRSSNTAAAVSHAAYAAVGDGATYIAHAATYANVAAAEASAAAYIAAAAYVAAAADDAACVVANPLKPIDFGAIAKKAMTYS